MKFGFLSPLAAMVLPGTFAQAQSYQHALDAYRDGRYEQVAGMLHALRREDPDWIRGRRLLVRTLAVTGRHDEAEGVARSERGAALQGSLGAVLALRGRRAAAESAYVRAIASRADDSLEALVGLARVLRDDGRRAESARALRRVTSAYNANAAGLDAGGFAAVGAACRMLGATDPRWFRDALRAYEEAITLDGDDPDIATSLGLLFLEKYNASEASRTFAGVLARNPRHPRALVGEARRRQFDGIPGADSLVARALALNPDDTDALLFRAEQAIAAEQDARALVDVERALRVNPASGPALALAAVLRHRAGDDAGVLAIAARVRGLDSTDASVYVTLADLAGRTRRYPDAVRFARAALEIDPADGRAHRHLGMNLLRTGDIAAGRASLEASFARDPYDVWVKNTLDLLDTFGSYALITSEHFRFMVDTVESRIMGVYLAELGERAWATFARRYAYRPPTPIRLELYRSHAEFSVRTVGLSGLGALGVSFGTTLAMDSPAARDAGAFNWGSTLWHEVAHTFTLGASANRVPRWLSEGLSVYEERRARPGWGMQVTPEFLAAWQAGKLPPLSRLNDGFVRPSYPAQVMHAYYQASLACEFIAQEWGERAFLELLTAYRAGASQDAAFAKVLGTNARELDQRFDTWMRARYQRVVASMPEWTEQMRIATAALRGGRHDRALASLERAVALFPEFAGDGGPYPLLVRAQLAAGDSAAALATLRTMVSRAEAPLEAHVMLATLAERRHDDSTAIDALERSMYIQPYDIARHERLATLYERTGNRRAAVRERLAVVSLDPVERSEALLLLALAYRDAGEVALARRTVLRALADAPDFRRAQDLLLALPEVKP